MAELASLVLFANDLDATAAFYLAVGLSLEDEAHDDGPRHVAIELGDVHFAVYQAESEVGAVASQWRAAATTFPGLYVDSLDSARGALLALGAELLADHQSRPWGCRIVVRDPDGRAVEINQRDHCSE